MSFIPNLRSGDEKRPSRRVKEGRRKSWKLEAAAHFPENVLQILYRFFRSLLTELKDAFTLLSLNLAPHSDLLACSFWFVG